MGKVEVAKVRLDDYIHTLEQAKVTDYWSGKDENVLQLMYLLKSIVDNLDLYTEKEGKKYAESSN